MNKHIANIEKDAAASSKFTILLTDDDIEDCLLFTEALAMLPIDAHLVLLHDGVQLMDYLHRFPLPDLLFLDLNMPRKSGQQALVEIKANARLSAIPVLILSTSTNEAKKAQLMEAGAKAYFSKPVEFTQLVKLLDEGIQLGLSASSPLTKTI